MSDECSLDLLKLESQAVSKEVTDSQAIRCATLLSTYASFRIAHSFIYIGLARLRLAKESLRAPAGKARKRDFDFLAMAEMTS